MTAFTLSSILIEQLATENSKDEYNYPYYLSLDRGILDKEIQQLPPLEAPLTITYLNPTPTTKPIKPSLSPGITPLERQKQQYLAKIDMIKKEIEFLNKTYNSIIKSKIDSYYTFTQQIMQKLKDLNQINTSLENEFNKIIKVKVHIDGQFTILGNKCTEILNKILSFENSIQEENYLENLNNLFIQNYQVINVEILKINSFSKKHLFYFMQIKDIHDNFLIYYESLELDKIANAEPLLTEFKNRQLQLKSNPSNNNIINKRQNEAKLFVKEPRNKYKFIDFVSTIDDESKQPVISELILPKFELPPTTPTAPTTPTGTPGATPTPPGTPPGATPGTPTTPSGATPKPTTPKAPSSGIVKLIGAPGIEYDISKYDGAAYNKLLKNHKKPFYDETEVYVKSNYAGVNIIKITAIYYNDKTKTGDFGDMIKEDRAKHCLFIFNDNIEYYKTTTSGGGNAKIRPEKKALKAWGIPTGAKGNGFKDLYVTKYNEDGTINTSGGGNDAKFYIDRAIEDIIKIIIYRSQDINNYVYQILYSTLENDYITDIEIDGTKIKTKFPNLENKIFTVDEDVKKYIIEKIYNIPFQLELKKSKLGFGESIAKAFNKTLPPKTDILAVGIKNVGNTCYANSAFQLLACINEFVDELLGAKIKDKDKDNNEQNKKNERGLKFIQELFNNLRAKKINIYDPNEKEFINFYNLLKMPSNDFGSQNDSHEFLRLLFEWLNKNTTMHLNYLKFMFREFRKLKGIEFYNLNRKYDGKKEIEGYEIEFIIEQEYSEMTDNTIINEFLYNVKQEYINYSKETMDYESYKYLYHYSDYIIIKLNLFDNNGIRFKKIYKIDEFLNVDQYSEEDLTRKDNVENLKKDYGNPNKIQYKLLGYIQKSGTPRGGHFKYYKNKDGISDKCLLLNDSDVSEIDCNDHITKNVDTGKNDSIPYIFLFKRVKTKSKMKKKNRNRIKDEISEFIIPYKRFNEKTKDSKWEIKGGHSHKKLFTYQNQDYYIKIMSVMNKKEHHEYEHYDFVLALNEVMASLLYNYIFELYAPILYLVHNQTGLNLKDIDDKYQINTAHFFVATKFETDKIDKKKSEEKYKLEDFIKGIVIDSIMGNYDISQDDNSFMIDKNSNNNKAGDNRFLRLDVGGTMLFRAQGLDKIDYINGKTPDELDKDNKEYGYVSDFADKKFKDKITPENINKSIEYLKQLNEENKLFNKLDIFKRTLLSNIKSYSTYTDLKEILIKFANKLINFNIMQIKRRILWYLNNYNTNMTFNVPPSFKTDEYYYPIEHNIQPNEVPKKWKTKEIYKLSYFQGGVETDLNESELNKLNGKLTNKKEKTIRIMTYNIGAVAKPNKDNSELKKLINEWNVDIECYQEVHVDYASKPYNGKDSGHKLECNPDRPGQYGVNTINFDETNLSKLKLKIIKNELKIIKNEGFELKKDGKKLASNGKCVNILELQFEGKKNHGILIYNVHLDVKNDDEGRNWREESLKLILDDYKKKQTGEGKYEEKKDEVNYPNAIILGDFNTYSRSEYSTRQLNKLYDVKGKDYDQKTLLEMGINDLNKTIGDKEYGENKFFSNEEEQKIIPIDVLKYAGWTEAFEINGLPSPVNTSHHSGKTDFIFLSPMWNLKINGLYTSYTTLSDHLPLFIDIEIPEISSGGFRIIKKSTIKQSPMKNENSKYSKKK